MLLEGGRFRERDCAVSGQERIGRYYEGDTSLRKSSQSIAHEPSDGRRCGRVLFFDIGTSKTLQVYPPAIPFRRASLTCAFCPLGTRLPTDDSEARRSGNEITGATYQRRCTHVRRGL